jgi:surface protein
MSIKMVQENSAYNRRFFKLPPTLPAASSSSAAWVRNPSWIALPSVGTSDQKFVGLVAVFPDTSGGEASNFLSLSAAGNYTVDWGDGVVENYNSGIQSYHVYDFNDADLANTDAPVTLTDSGDLVQRTTHGYTNGMAVRFYNIVSTTGITEGQTYYVINANANDFQVSTTVGGSAVALTTNGSATLLEYKQAVVTITPQAGQNLTNINIDRRHNQSGLNSYNANWLDITLGAPNFSRLTLAPTTPTSTVYINILEQINLVNTGTITSFANFFFNLRGLRNIIIGTIGTIVSTTSMFQNCSSLTNVPLFNTASVENMSSMFSGCSVLVSVPLFNTASVTNMSSMFSSCRLLVSVPFFNTAIVTNMNNMFDSCFSLASVPALNFNSVTSLTNTFASCAALSDIKATGATITHSIGSLKLSRAALKKYMDNLGAGATRILTISTNWGVGTNATKTVSSTAQSTTVTCADTSSLSVGMMMTGTGTGINGVSATSNVTTNTLTLNNHGLPNGTRVSFSALGTTTGVSINIIYFVVNSATNTFQIALTAGGGAIDLTGSNATMTLRYPNYITSINTNVSVILDVPAAASAASTSWIFRTVDSYGALLRGWAVTY